MKIVRNRLKTGQLREYRYPAPGEPGERSIVTLSPGHAPRRRYTPNTVPTDFRPEFGQAVRSARRRRGLTLDQVTERLGRHESYLSLIETQGRVPMADVVDALAGVLEVDPDEFRVLAGYAPVSVTPEDLLREPLIPELREVLRELGTLHPCGQRGAARRIDAHLSP